jgi:hypothetical protein
MSTRTATVIAANSEDRRLANLVPHKFKKGQSGNPAGRPKKRIEISDLAREHAGKAMRTLIKLIDSTDDKVALAAANAVLDRALGKPKQAVDVNQHRDMADFSDAELLAIARMGQGPTTVRQ